MGYTDCVRTMLLSCSTQFRNSYAMFSRKSPLAYRGKLQMDPATTQAKMTAASSQIPGFLVDTQKRA
jgi:hypothetical protein